MVFCMFYQAEIGFDMRSKVGQKRNDDFDANVSFDFLR